MATHVELYEALKPHIGAEAAEMIAEVVPPASEIATRGDIARLEIATRADIARLESETRADIARLESATRADITRLESETRADIARLESATRADITRLEVKIAEVKAEIYASETRQNHKLLTYFIPLWVMMGGQVLAIVGLVATRL